MSFIDVREQTKNKKHIEGATYLCLLESFSKKHIVEALLKYVPKDDVEWRTADDNSEIGYEWNVIYSILMKEPETNPPTQEKE